MHLEEDVKFEVLEGEVEQLLALLRASTDADGTALRAMVGTRKIEVSIGAVGVGLGDLDPDDSSESALRTLPDGRDLCLVPLAGLDGWIVAVRKDQNPFSANEQRITQMVAELVAKQFDAERENRKLTQQLDVANRELEQFAYLAAHEVIAPLRAVVVYAQLLDQLVTPDQNAVDEVALRTCVEEIHNGVSLMDHQLKNLRALATVGADVADPVPCDLNEIVRHVLETRSQCIAESNVTVVTGELPTVLGARGPLERVFGTLLSNAIRYRDPRRPLTVDVTAEANGSSWIVRVADNGAGVDEEDRFRIFELFERASKTSAGSGIGLPLSRRIVEGLGGSMGVLANADGGATFWVEFPQIKPGDHQLAIA